ncbi:MAG: hypothetical protein ACLFQ8_01850 [Candidatus Aenigmatarchaeota archaeon]
MSKSLVDSYCERYREVLSEYDIGNFPEDIPPLGLVTEDYFSYPIPQEHKDWLERASGANFDTAFVLKVGERLRENAMKRDPYPAVKEREFYRSIDEISREAVEDISENPKASGVIRKGEDYLALSIFENDILDKGRVLKLLSTMKEKVDESLKVEEDSVGYYIK